MFKCEQCPLMFTYKENLIVHQNMHAGVNFPCTICPISFTKKSNLNGHIKNIHAVTRIQPVLQPGEIEIAPNIIVPDQAAGPSNQIQITYNSNNILNEHFNDDGYDEMCVEALDRAENSGLCGSSNKIHNSNNIPKDHFDDDGYDEMCMEVLNRAENAGLCDKPGEKRVHVDNTPQSPPISCIMAPKKFKTTSPQNIHENDTPLSPTQSLDTAPRHLFLPFFFDGECSQISLTPATWVPVNKAPNDENDGPLHFNQLPRQE